MKTKQSENNTATKRATRRSIPAETLEIKTTQENLTEVSATPKKKRLSSLEKLVQEASKVIERPKKETPSISAKNSQKSKERKSLDSKSPNQASILDYVSPKTSAENEPKTSKKKTETAQSNSTPRRGRPPKTPTNKKVTPKKYEEVSETESSEYNEDDDDDEEFKLDHESSESSEESNDENESEISNQKESEEDEEEEEYDEELEKSTKRKSTRSNYKKTKDIPSVSEVKLVDTFNFDEKIEKWEYELEPSIKLYCRPVIPALSDQALQPYLNDKSTKKSTIYDCPFCKNHFTYNLVFKTHLFSCSKNPNVPEYVLFCCKHPECSFKGQRRQEMINHYNKTHVNDASIQSLESHLDSVQLDSSVRSNSSLTDSALMSTTKKNQLEVSRYYYIDKNQLKYSLDYFNKSIALNYKSLQFIDKFNTDQHYDHHLLTCSQIFHNECELKFRLGNTNVNLKPFELYQTKQPENVCLINVINQITALDWCPNKENETSQFLAFSHLPLKSICNHFGTALINDSRNRVKDINETANLVYFLKTNLNETETEIYALLNRTIGTISTLKWRPDCGASVKSDFLGYLLATSSNGCAFIFCVNDLTQNKSYTKDNTVIDQFSQAFNRLNVFEPKKKLVLKSRFSYGQCTSGDWLQLNGATQIALGYTSGEVGIYQINSNFLKQNYSLTQPDECLTVYPIKTFNAHLSFIKDLKWSKFDANLLASGSTFSRDIKVWNITNTAKPFIEYEIFVTEFEFSLHSNHLFIAKETNLKGENHLFVLDLSFNVYNKEKDESRSKSSLFYTNGTMNSIDQSDYLNKLLICDSDGCLIVSSSNNPNHWIPKHQLMFNSFSQVACFQMLNEPNEPTKYFNQGSDDKLNQVLLINLDRKIKDKKSKPKENANLINSNRVGLNNLTKVKWNPNCKYLNWYAVGSGSGFIFFHKLNELKLDLD